MLVISISIAQSSTPPFVGIPITKMQSSNLTFPSFQKLPTELQQMVWSYALLPRVVTFRFRNAGPSWTSDKTRAFVVATPVALLQVCREARQVALRSYVNIFPKSNPKGAYIDYSRDTLYFEMSQDSGFRLVYFEGSQNTFFNWALHMVDTHQVRFLAIDVDYCCYSRWGEKFTQLKEVMFVARTPAIGPSKGETEVILKDIDADYKRKKVDSMGPFIETFTDVFKLVSQNFGSGSRFVFRPAHRVSLMELDTVQCSHVFSWDLGLFLQT
jgi:hypothetical protein